MTRFGKYLVLFNLLLSMLFLAWSVGIYTQRLHWADGQTSDGEKITGRVTELTGEIRKLSEARDKADAKWFAAATALTKLEVERPQRRDFYNDMLQAAARGSDRSGRAVNPPVQDFRPELEKNTLAFNKKTGRPAIQIDGKNALSAAGYKDAVTKQFQAIQAEQTRTENLIKQAAALSKKINGTKAPGEAITAVEKGLRGLIADQNWLKLAAQQEQQYLQTPLTNVTLELELLKRRQAALQTRLKELQGGVAVTKRD